MSAIDKVTNHVESPITRVRKLSPTVTHVYNTYPLVEQLSTFLLGFQFVNYLATLFSKVFLKFHDDVLVKFAPLVLEWYTKVDEFILNTLFVGVVDKYAPLFTELHAKDLTPSAVYAKSKSLATSSYTKFSDKTKPTVIATVNPILSPVNTSLERAIGTYLPKPTDAAAGVAPTSTDEIDKLMKLTTTVYQRSIPLIDSKFQAAKKYPVELQSHVSKIYQSKLDKNDKSIPRAVVGTSQELTAETLHSLGFTENKTLAETTSTQLGEVVESLQNGADGIISVGA